MSEMQVQKDRAIREVKLRNYDTAESKEFARSQTARRYFDPVLSELLDFQNDNLSPLKRSIFNGETKIIEYPIPNPDGSELRWSAESGKEQDQYLVQWEARMVMTFLNVLAFVNRVGLQPGMTRFTHSDRLTLCIPGSITKRRFSVWHLLAVQALLCAIKSGAVTRSHRAIANNPKSVAQHRLLAIRKSREEQPELQPEAFDNCIEVLESLLVDKTFLHEYVKLNPLFGSTQLLRALYAGRAAAALLEEQGRFIYCTLHIYNTVYQLCGLNVIWHDLESILAQHGNEKIFGQKDRPSQWKNTRAAYHTSIKLDRYDLVVRSRLMQLLLDHIKAKGDGSEELRKLQEYIVEHMDEVSLDRTSPTNDPTVAEQVASLNKLVNQEAAEWHFDYLTFQRGPCAAVIKAALDTLIPLMSKVAPEEAPVPEEALRAHPFVALSSFHDVMFVHGAEADRKKALTQLRMKLQMIIKPVSDYYIKRAEMEMGKEIDGESYRIVH